MSCMSAVASAWPDGGSWLATRQSTGILPGPLPALPAEDFVPRMFLQAAQQQEPAPATQAASGGQPGVPAIAIGGISAGAGQGAASSSLEEEAIEVLEAADAAEAQLSTQQQQARQPASSSAATAGSPFGSAGLRAAQAACAAAALLAQRPLSAAAGVAASAARSARSGAGGCACHGSALSSPSRIHALQLCIICGSLC